MDRIVAVALFVAVSCYVIIVDVRAMLGCHAVVDVVKMLLLVALLAVLLLVLRSLFINFTDECPESRMMHAQSIMQFCE